jgi:endonuclease-3
MPWESAVRRSERAAAVLQELVTVYPEATTELAHKSPFELLIATMLSAQATDKSVNAASPSLFRAYPDAPRLATADPSEVMSLIRTIGLYRTKAKNIIRTSRILTDDFGGRVPNDFDSLLSLPGVGRKTANVVLATAFGRPAIAVDTHVGRLARRLRFSNQNNPNDVEDDLERIFPKKTWIFLHHALILHGRRICHARSPACTSCQLRELCPGRLN